VGEGGSLLTPLSNSSVVALPLKIPEHFARGLRLLASWGRAAMRQAFRFMFAGVNAAGALIALIASPLSDAGTLRRSEPRYSLTSGAVPKGELPVQAPEQYVRDKLQLSAVHRMARGTHVPIAVIDSEIDESHPDLNGAVSLQYEPMGVKELPHPAQPADSVKQDFSNCFIKWSLSQSSARILLRQQCIVGWRVNRARLTCSTKAKIKGYSPMGRCARLSMVATKEAEPSTELTGNFRYTFHAPSR
jgi:hypothetical protein